jgi:hypothetical protein
MSQFSLSIPVAGSTRGILTHYTPLHFAEEGILCQLDKYATQSQCVFGPPLPFFSGTIPALCGPGNAMPCYEVMLGIATRLHEAVCNAGESTPRIHRDTPCTHSKAVHRSNFTFILSQSYSSRNITE